MCFGSLFKLNQGSNSNLTYIRQKILFIWWLTCTNNYFLSVPFRWSWMIVWCQQIRVCCFVISSVRTKVCTSAAPESTASAKPWSASPSRSSRRTQWMSSLPVTLRASLTGSKTGLQGTTGPGCLAARGLTAGVKSASRARGSRTSCSSSGRLTCLTLRSTARGCGATTSSGGSTRACWRNTAKLKRVPGRRAVKAPENATGHHEISEDGESNTRENEQFEIKEKKKIFLVRVRMVLGANLKAWPNQSAYENLVD